MYTRELYICARHAIFSLFLHKVIVIPLPTDLVHAAELELGLLLGDTVENEPSLRVVQQAEQVARLLDLHHVCLGQKTIVTVRE